MPKNPRASLEAMVREAEERETPVIAAVPEHPATGSNVVTLERDNAKTSRRQQHTSLYLHPNVRRAIREIAFQYDRKPHDLYMEGIDMMLVKYGKAGHADLAKK